MSRCSRKPNGPLRCHESLAEATQPCLFCYSGHLNAKKAPERLTNLQELVGDAAPAWVSSRASELVEARDLRTVYEGARWVGCSVDLSRSDRTARGLLTARALYVASMLPPNALLVDAVSWYDVVCGVSRRLPAGSAAIARPRMRFGVNEN
jgi:hypothetical protein